MVLAFGVFLSPLSGRLRAGLVLWCEVGAGASGQRQYRPNLPSLSSRGHNIWVGATRVWVLGLRKDVRAAFRVVLELGNSDMLRGRSLCFLLSDGSSGVSHGKSELLAACI